MTTLLQAASFASLSANPPTTAVNKMQSAKSLLAEIRCSRMWGREWFSSKKFVLVRLPLGRVGNPIRPDQNKLLQTIACAADSVKPVVVDLNIKEIGSSKGFYPRAIVVHGIEVYAAAEIQGRDTVPAWVGVDALKLLSLKAETQIGDNELRSKLDKLLQGKFKIANTNQLPDAWISDIFPVDSYTIYQRGGQMYKQSYNVDEGRNVSLVGIPIAVRQVYVEAARAKSKSIQLPQPKGQTIKLPKDPVDGTPDTKMEAKKKKTIKADDDEEDMAASSVGIRAPLHVSAVMRHPAIRRR
jgi:hypothetical protein